MLVILSVDMGKYGKKSTVKRKINFFHVTLKETVTDHVVSL